MRENTIGIKSVFGLGIALVFSGICLAQTDLPIPADCPGYGISGTLFINVGDFDGDSTDDIGYGLFNSTSSQNALCIYSLKKQAILLEVKGNGSIQAIGDFNGDGKKEVVINSKIYSFTGTLAKKKL
jgi:hypothetical protein